MAPLHQAIGIGQHRRRRERGEERMEGHDMIEESGRAVVLQDLPCAGIKEEPTYEDTQEEDDEAIEFGFGHSPRPFLGSLQCIAAVLGSSGKDRKVMNFARIPS